MKKLSLFLFILTFSINSFAQQSFKALVVGVVDGDTITVMTKEKRQITFRLAGIDAPEKEQDFGATARSFLSNSVQNQTVTVSDLKKDCAGDLSASVSFNNKDLSLSAIESGNAWAGEQCQRDESLFKAQVSAKERRVGLWSGANPVKPSDFRIASKEPPTVANQTSARRIFTGLAPTPPPILTSSGKPSGLYIGMFLDDFIDICGSSGVKSKMYTSGSLQSFDIDIPAKKENSEKGCDGNFTFSRTPKKPLFILSSVIQ